MSSVEVLGVYTLNDSLKSCFDFFLKSAPQIEGQAIGTFDADPSKFKEATFKPHTDIIPSLVFPTLKSSPHCSLVVAENARSGKLEIVDGASASKTVSIPIQTLHAKNHEDVSHILNQINQLQHSERLKLGSTESVVREDERIYSIIDPDMQTHRAKRRETGATVEVQRLEESVLEVYRRNEGVMLSIDHLFKSIDIFCGTILPHMPSRAQFNSVVGDMLEVGDIKEITNPQTRQKFIVLTSHYEEKLRLEQELEQEEGMVSIEQ
ncbi:hypothetical protein PCE1_000835 [Barthelona sp. PCE]